MERPLTLHVPTTDNLSAGQAIVTFSFGQGMNNTPGGTNHALAAMIKTILAVYPLPVLAQREVANALAALGIGAVYTAVPQNGYLSTQGVWDQFIEHLPPAKQLILIAHPDHRSRCRHIIQQSAHKVLVPGQQFSPPNGWQAYGCDIEGYDPTSVQPWTRNRTRFIKYEISVRKEAGLL